MNVIILCQGQQTRLADLGHYKHYLCVDGERIINRTLRLVADLTCLLNLTVVAEPDFELPQVTSIQRLTLPNPGNCVLDGLWAARSVWEHESQHPRQHTVVLLGDVVYSRQALFDILDTAYLEGIIFHGTPNLSTTHGEVFAVSFDPESALDLAHGLGRAPCRLGHADVADYQPGHLRNLILQKLVPHKFVTVDDWTTDIDTPKDLERLEFLTQQVVKEKRRKSLNG